MHSTGTGFRNWNQYQYWTPSKTQTSPQYRHVLGIYWTSTVAPQNSAAVCQHFTHHPYTSGCFFSSLRRVPKSPTNPTENNLVLLSRLFLLSSVLSSFLFARGTLTLMSSSALRLPLIVLPLHATAAFLQKPPKGLSHQRLQNGVVRVTIGQGC